MQEAAVRRAAHRKAVQLASNAGPLPIARLGPNRRPHPGLMSKSRDQPLKQSREPFLRSLQGGQYGRLLRLAPLWEEELNRFPLSVGMRPSGLQNPRVLRGH